MSGSECPKCGRGAEKVHAEDCPYNPKNRVEPLKQRTMTLDQLQHRTIEVLRLMVKQLGKAPYEDGLSDNEFIAQIIDPFDADIRTDRYILKMENQRK